MKHLRYSGLYLFVLTLALVFIGCAKPPDAEKSAAQSALKAATTAGAEKYAAAPMEAGKMLWGEAEKLLKGEQYDAAKAVYMAAKTTFDKATKTAVAAKKALTDEVTKTVASLEEQWKTLEAAVLAMEKKMKDQKALWDADALLFAQELQATKGMIATNPEGTKAKAEELKAMIDKWDTTIKELEKIPEKPVKKGRK